MNAAPQVASDALVRELAAVVGATNVVTDDTERAFFATDIYRAGALPAAVVRPASAAEVAAVVRACVARGVAVVPRGGGASYTDGYVPSEDGSISLDTSRMDRILEINERDMYVVVQVGITWAELNEALAARGLRTPFYGPFSGLAATVGGSLSQNSVTWGTGVFGVSGETPLGVEVVLGTGEVLDTAQIGASAREAFFRPYGPDISGLFTGDAGALGIKTAVTL
ncbi:MAG: FAD-binding oxidoreductase, partial [Gammaproteobacteria bacterium]